MIDPPPNRPATRDEIVAALSYGLRFNTSGKATRVAHDAMAALAAQQIADYLDQAGFVVMKRPPAPKHRAP